VLRMKGSVGTPFPGGHIELESFDDDDRKSNGFQGEIAVSGPHGIAEYRNRLEDTEKSLTPKLKRDAVEQHFADLIEQMDRKRGRPLAKMGEKTEVV
jgi:long-subunit acyl-CoA synthetase (AMP-forming)